MDKRAILDAASANAEERLLLGRVWDQYDRCRLKGLPTATAFLSHAQQVAAKRLLTTLCASEEEYCLHGGYEGAERCRLELVERGQQLSHCLDGADVAAQGVPQRVGVGLELPQ
jgi:hypothetical protein